LTTAFYLVRAVVREGADYGPCGRSKEPILAAVPYSLLTAGPEQDGAPAPECKRNLHVRPATRDV